MPLDGLGVNGADVANPVLADGVAFVQDGASNVTAVEYATGQVLWTRTYNSRAYGPNGGQLWYVTDFGPQKVEFNLAPQVADRKVFVASSITAGGGIIYALDADSGAIDWSFQTVIGPIGQQLKATAGGAWDPVLIGPDQSVYAGIGNPYLSQQQAQETPSSELYTDSLLKLNQADGKLEWYYQAFPNDFHDWDLQVSPIYTMAGGHPVVLAAGKGGFVFAFDRHAAGRPAHGSSRSDGWRGDQHGGGRRGGVRAGGERALNVHGYDVACRLLRHDERKWRPGCPGYRQRQTAVGPQGARNTARSGNCQQ